LKKGNEKAFPEAGGMGKPVADMLDLWFNGLER